LAGRFIRISYNTVGRSSRRRAREKWVGQGVTPLVTDETKAAILSHSYPVRTGVLRFTGFYEISRRLFPSTANVENRTHVEAINIDVARFRRARCVFRLRRIINGTPKLFGNPTGIVVVPFESVCIFKTVRDISSRRSFPKYLTI